MIFCTPKLSIVATVAMTTLLACASVFAQTTTSEPRLSTSTFNGVITQHSSTDNNTKSAQRSLTPTKRTVQNHNHGLWIYDLYIDLTTDIDFDGHYSAFTVSLDIESSFNPQTVYAVFYLSRNNGPWFEYASTGNFIVSGTGPQDAIFIETSLDSGYLTGFYDHYVEIYDAYDGSLLISYGPEQSGYGYSLAFESYSDDNYVSPVSVRVSFSGTGSLPLTTLLFCMGLIAIRRYSPKLR